MAPSGNRIMRLSSVPPVVAPAQRVPVASRGRESSFGGGILFLDPECSRRRPCGLHVREVQGIELGPENVALVPQRMNRKLLLLACFGIFVYIRSSELRIFWRLRQSCCEVV